MPEGSVWKSCGRPAPSKPTTSVLIPKGLTPPLCVYRCCTCKAPRRDDIQCPAAVLTQRGTQHCCQRPVQSRARSAARSRRAG
jgi:hypothetical protein